MEPPGVADEQHLFDGKYIRLRVRDIDDLDRSIQHSEMARIFIPSLGFEMKRSLSTAHSVLTVTEFVQHVVQEIRENAFGVQNSTVGPDQANWNLIQFLTGMAELIDEDQMPWDFIIRDPLGHSSIESRTGDDESNVIEEWYGRTEEENSWCGYLRLPFRVLSGDTADERLQQAAARLASAQRITLVLGPHAMQRFAGSEPVPKVCSHRFDAPAYNLGRKAAAFGLNVEGPRVPDSATQPLYWLWKQLLARPAKPLHAVTALAMRLHGEGRLEHVLCLNVDHSRDDSALHAAELVTSVHGSLFTAKCASCASSLDVTPIAAQLAQDEALSCPACCDGMVVPGIHYPDGDNDDASAVHERGMEFHLMRSDLLLVLGDAALDATVAQLLEQVPASTPRILVNAVASVADIWRWNGETQRDVFMKAECAAGVERLCHLAGIRTDQAEAGDGA